MFRPLLCVVLLVVAYSSSPCFVAWGQEPYLPELQWNLSTSTRNEKGSNESRQNLSVLKWKDDFLKELVPQKSAALQKRELLDGTASKRKKRETELRTNAGIQDQVSGVALNSIYTLLLSPSIDANQWKDHPIALPEGMLNDLSFLYRPIKGTPSPLESPQQFNLQELSMLKAKEWPKEWSEEGFRTEREDFQSVYKSCLKSIQNADHEYADLTKSLRESIRSLNQTAKDAKSAGKLTRIESQRYAKELEVLIPSFEYVSAMRSDLASDTPDTVEELILFMLKFRLQFAAAKGSRSTDRYGELYDAFRQQLQSLGLLESQQGDETSPGEIDLIDGFKQWKYTGDAKHEFSYSVEEKAVKTFGKNKRENATGKASITFVVPDNVTYLTFEMAGGDRPVTCNITLTADEKQVFKETGHRQGGDGQPRDSHRSVKWNIAGYRGKSVTFSIVDNKQQDKKGEVFCWISAKNIRLE